MKKNRLSDSEILERVNLIEKIPYYKSMVFEYLSELDFIKYRIGGRLFFGHKKHDLRVYVPDKTFVIYYEDQIIRSGYYDENTISLIQQVINLVGAHL